MSSYGKKRGCLIDNEAARPMEGRANCGRFKIYLKHLEYEKNFVQKTLLGRLQTIPVYTGHGIKF